MSFPNRTPREDRTCSSVLQRVRLRHPEPVLASYSGVWSNATTSRVRAKLDALADTHDLLGTNFGIEQIEGALSMQRAIWRLEPIAGALFFFEDRRSQGKNVCHADRAI